jgi:acetyl-CoA synthetase
VAPNVIDADLVRVTFTWAWAREHLDGLPGGGLNIAHEAVDRHAFGPLRTRQAFRFVRRDGSLETMTYGDLAAASNRFANVIAELGVEPGEAVYFLLGRIPELYVGVMGALKHRAVVCTLFAAFGPEPIRQRLELGHGVALVTAASLYRKRVAGIRDTLPDLRHVIVVDDTGRGASGPAPEGTVWLDDLMGAASSAYSIGPTTEDTPSLLHFTSGTTGTPKGAVHVHGAATVHWATGWAVLDLHDDDTFWCTADPGWVTGTSYGIIAPLLHGVTSVVDEGDFDADRWYGLVERERVTVWYTAPTAIRMMMKAGPEAVAGHDLSSVRFAASVGEPLNPEAVRWGEQVLHLVFHDNWWQTETGGIMLANLACMEVKPGSMGKPVPGIQVGLLRCDDNGTLVLSHGRPVELTGADVQGLLAIRTPWPSMFRTYLGQEDRYRKCFADGWYVSGDVASRDADGYYWFVGRADDVIKTAGHLIGPFEVENTLMEHPAVAEAGAYGVPDPLAGALVHAVVSLRPGYEPSDDLSLDLIGHARKRLGAAVAPRWIGFAPDIPKTKSGKIMRRLLRARELGLPEGDTSTLEGGTAS